MYSSKNIQLTQPENYWKWTNWPVVELTDMFAFYLTTAVTNDRIVMITKCQSNVRYVLPKGVQFPLFVFASHSLVNLIWLSNEFDFHVCLLSIFASYAIFSHCRINVPIYNAVYLRNNQQFVTHVHFMHLNLDFSILLST